MASTVEFGNSKIRAAILGSAICDSLGALVEFQRPGDFKHLDAGALERWQRKDLDETWNNPWKLNAGEFTDDTIMAMCLLESMTTTNKFDPVDQLARYREWVYRGHWSPKGNCFDIGSTTRRGCCRSDTATHPILPLSLAHRGGNGCIMRASPMAAALLHCESPGLRAFICSLQSRTTHSDPSCVQASFLHQEICRAFLLGEIKESALAPGRFSEVMFSAEVASVEGMSPITPHIFSIVSGGYQRKLAPWKKSSGRKAEGRVYAGYLADEALDAALWALHRTDSFVDGALIAVNLGDDSDTVGAIYGSIAGYCYGMQSDASHGDKGLPLNWAEMVWRSKEINVMVDKLIDLVDASSSPAAPASSSTKAPAAGAGSGPQVVSTGCWGAKAAAPTPTAAPAAPSAVALAPPKQRLDLFSAVAGYIPASLVPLAMPTAS
jgi:ADP-ribosyl-[dinitrogen reductase] hydrolase